MLNRWGAIVAAAFIFIAGLTVVSARQAQTGSSAPQAQGAAAPAARPGNGWVLPPDADQEKNPLAGDAAAISAGKQLFGKNCQRCHGPGGKGDGPDGDPDSQQDINMTVARRAARNPDGVIFYKVWNGRAKPKMPAFKDSLEKDDVWKIVSFVQTLRDKS